MRCTVVVELEVRSADEWAEEANVRGCTRKSSTSRRVGAPDLLGQTRSRHDGAELEVLIEILLLLDLTSSMPHNLLHAVKST